MYTLVGAPRIEWTYTKLERLIVPLMTCIVPELVQMVQGGDTSGTPLRAYARNRGFLIGRRSTIVTIQRKSLPSSAIHVRRARTVLCMESRSYALASKNSHIKTTTTTTTTMTT